MYTEYVFENKKYNVAASQIKSLLYDITAAEDQKITELRDKAFVQARDETLAAELQGLYVQQDASLREIYAMGEKLIKAIQKADSCSRKLKQIEGNYTSQIVEYVENNANQLQNAAPVQTVVEEKAPAPVMVTTEAVHEEGDALAAKAEQKKETGAEPVAVAPAAGKVPAEVVMDFDDDAYKTKQEAKAQEEENKDEPVMVSENAPAEEKKVSDEVVMDFDDDAYKAKQEAKAKGEEKTEENADAVSAPVIVPDTAPLEEKKVSAEVVMDFDDDAYKTKQEAKAQEEENKEENPQEPVLTITTDAPAEATSAPVIAPVIETTQEVTEETGGPVLTPVTTDEHIVKEEKKDEEIISNGDELIPITTDVGSEEKLTFKKRSADPPKVIMISGKQAAKLKASLPTQEALLSAKGFFKTEKEEILDDVDEKQKQLEEMMNQANELYAAGKVDEAQSMYDKISVLNKTLQGENK